MWTYSSYWQSGKCPRLSATNGGVLCQFFIHQPESEFQYFAQFSKTWVYNIQSSNTKNQRKPSLFLPALNGLLNRANVLIKYKAKKYLEWSVEVSSGNENISDIEIKIKECVICSLNPLNQKHRLIISVRKILKHVLLFSIYICPLLHITEWPSASLQRCINLQRGGLPS